MPSSDGRRFSEMIGGYNAELWSNQFEGMSYTGAIWRAPKTIHITGEARDRITAILQLDVYRTVRFATP
ncbi:MAG: hypothetical protein ACT4O1_06905 [Gemmatimonadota bacterium]